jgi:2-keto-3-deoxy-L-rhamnonate aldolase RhmA
MKAKIGTWMSIHSPVIAELAAQCGFDWLLFDLEHGCGTEASILPQLQAIRGTAAQAIVRVGEPHRDLISRVLDWGAHGIMVPHVNSAAEAESVVRASRYSPVGTRGFSRTVRANDYGLRPIESVPSPLIVAQIETLESVNRAAGIAGVDGVDVLFVGPSDLRHDIAEKRVVNVSKHGEQYEECLLRVLDAARHAGKQAGILIRDVAELEKHREMGFTYIAVDSDIAILRKSYLQVLGK